MAQQDLPELLKRAVEGKIPRDELIRALVDRTAATMRIGEGLLIDFKRALGSAGELAKDILGFANMQGGILLFGIDDAGNISGHAPLDAAQIRGQVGPYIGTRVEYEIECVKANVQNREVSLPYIFVRRTTAPYPGLLRRDVELRKGMWQKVRYLAGSLPYRDGDTTKVALVGEDVSERAQALGFKLVAPRTRSSFLVQEDRPGMRVYGHINSQFIGRENEIAALLAQFADPRGRGVSIGGLGGIGKTELAIALVAKLKGSQFHRIYSGSSKRMLLTPLGFQEADPEFHDHPSFLRDLCGWLGIEAGNHETEALEATCIEALARIGQRALLFVDNLETVEDARLLKFLDSRLPRNVWLVVTSRVHRVRNFLYAYDLTEMIPRDAARLLRHELKVQGLDDLASLDINLLEGVVRSLHHHPLAIRWFAWLCRQDRGNWSKGPNDIPKQDLETFCVGHTLSHLTEHALEALAIVACCQDQTEVDRTCVASISKKRPDLVDAALYELETAGLVTVATDGNTGKSTYGVVQLAVAPVRELARSRGMEKDIAAGLRAHLSRPPATKVDPLVRYLVELNPANVRHMEPEEIVELLRRIGRARKSPSEFDLELLQLEAECYRHQGNPITAGDLYSQAAERVLQTPQLLRSERFQSLLLEAATVTRQLGTSSQQLERIVRYLEALPDHHMSPLRVPGLLCEAYAGLKSRQEYDKWRQLLRQRLDEDGSYSEEQRAQAEAALARAARL